MPKYTVSLAFDLW